MKSKKLSGELRIIGGRWRSRKLRFSAQDQLRPTANRIRETLFNWLRDDIQNENCLDLFAGSGACGLEALSRGAHQVIFVEKNKIAADSIKANLETLGEADIPVNCVDVFTWLASQERSRDSSVGIVFIDPPYAESLESECCEKLEKSGLLKDRALVFLESDKNLATQLFPRNWRVLRSRQAGLVYYYLLERCSKDHDG